MPYILLVFAKYPSFFCFQIHLNHYLYSISIVDKKAICKKLNKNKARPGRQPVPGGATEIIRQIP